jgi:hypothetical protein
VTTRTEGLARPRGFASSHRRALMEERRDEEAIELVSLPHQRRPAGVGRACGGRARNRATQTCASGVPRSLRASTRHHDWSRRAGVGRERTISGFDGGAPKRGRGLKIAAGARGGARTCTRHPGRKINGWKIGRAGRIRPRPPLRTSTTRARAVPRRRARIGVGARAGRTAARDGARARRARSVGRVNAASWAPT